MRRQRTGITIDPNGEEMDFVRFLNSLLPQKPDLERNSRRAIERAQAMIPFDMLALCLEPEAGSYIDVVYYARENSPDALAAAARDRIMIGKDIVFPSWKGKEIEEKKVIVGGKGGQPGEKFESVIFQKVEDAAKGMLHSFSCRENAFNEKHEFVLGILAHWLVSYFAMARIYEKIESLSVTDPLTGIFNRRKFEQEIEMEIERSKRYRLDFSVIMIDVDDLKSVNDRYGHYAGDLLLQHFARLLTHNLRKVDIVTRIGGDEFMAILPHTGADGARVACERILGLLRKEPMPFEKGAINYSFTMSVASFQPDDSPESLYRRVDAGLIEAKKTCKGSYHVI